MIAMSWQIFAINSAKEEIAGFQIFKEALINSDWCDAYVSSLRQFAKWVCVKIADFKDF
jgi:hypothetical protein